MVESSVECTLRRSIFSRMLTAEFAIRFHSDVAKIFLPQFAQSLLSQLQLTHLWLSDAADGLDSKKQSRQAVNFRGRPRESFTDGTMSPPRLHNKEEEIFYCEHEFETIHESEKISEILRYQLKSTFESSDSKVIRYRLAPSFSPELAAIVPFLRIKDFVALVPGRLSLLRIGVEFFQPSYFGSFLGFTPNLCERFYFMATKEEVYSLVSFEGYKKDLPELVKTNPRLNALLAVAQDEGTALDFSEALVNALGH